MKKTDFCPVACKQCVLCPGHPWQKTYEALRRSHHSKQARAQQRRQAETHRQEPCQTEFGTRGWLKQVAPNGSLPASSPQLPSWVAVPCADMGSDAPLMARSRSRKLGAPALAACIQSFRDPPEQPARFVSRLANAPFKVQIIVNDDGQVEGGSAAWMHALRPGDIYLISPNIHEVRAFNTMARYAMAPLIVFLQGDECLPISSEWLLDGMLIFEHLPKLAILGGHVGFASTGDAINPDATGAWGAYPRRTAIPHALPIWRDIAVTHVALTIIGPYFARREAFVQLGGFSMRWGAVGEPGGVFDMMLALRCWLSGHSVAIYYGGAGNGIGGHKTRTGKMLQLRELHDAATYADLNASWAQSNESVASMVQVENSHLSRLPRRLARQLHRMTTRRESKAACLESQVQGSSSEPQTGATLKTTPPQS